MKTTFVCCSLLVTFIVQSQVPSAEAVLSAERSFANYAVANGTKAAFLNFLDSAGVVFEKGKALNGIEAWKKKQSSGVLNWQPIYGAISASGDLGFTTGPWTFQPKTVNDSIVARGQYATVWQKTKSGEWKFVVDLGVGKTPSFNDAVFTFTEHDNKFIPGTWNNLLNREQKFITQAVAADTAARRKAYEGALSRYGFFLNRNGNLPVIWFTGLAETINAMPKKINYTIDGSGISAAGDLGYVYGNTVINAQQENYLRIWRREGKEWKLALEVLRY